MEENVYKISVFRAQAQAAVGLSLCFIMPHILLKLALATTCVFSLTAFAIAAPLAATVNIESAHSPDSFHLGTAKNPAGTSITVDRDSLRLDGKPWTPVMGEYHFARYPHQEWETELRKMKAGGIEIVATYVFWIYHEEVENQWDWSGDRNLREFIQLADKVGLKVIVRCGPWCHGEVRNGGFPDWLFAKGWKLRSEDPGFFRVVKTLYQQIDRQLDGLLWKDGGTVIGIQLENEYPGPAEYLLALKRVAREAGLDVPIYTRTGWPQLTTPMPFGEIVPLYGSYAEGFWDRKMTSMPGDYWNGFRFSKLRVDDNIANEQLGHQGVHDAPDVARYPYLTCEIGGGMMNSYHRRILIDPADVESTTLVKLGSGSTLPGYYMYHGGVNPEGKLSTMMETQATQGTNYNDLPVRNYDFQAPLGAFGEIRPQYHLLRRLHLFLEDFGSTLADMPVTLPEVRPRGKDDVTTLRWAARSNGTSGYVFVNNYERSQPLAPKYDVQFSLALPSGTFVFPATPIDVLAGARFIWPFNLDLGSGLKLSYATAQLICKVEDGDTRTVFFAQTLGVPAQFAVTGESTVRNISPSRNVAFSLQQPGDKTVRIVLLSESDSLALWKEKWAGQDRVFISQAGLVADDDEVTLTSENRADLSVGVYPAPKSFAGKEDGIFVFSTVAKTNREPKTVETVQVRSAGAPRDIPLGHISEPVSTEPDDADFARAAVWKVKLPENLDLSTNPLLRFHYHGDVARIMLNGKLLIDDFYNGRTLDLGLRRYAPEIFKGELTIAILPLRKDAVISEHPKIFVAKSALPVFGDAASIAEVSEVELVTNDQVRFSAHR